MNNISIQFPKKSSLFQFKVQFLPQKCILRLKIAIFRGSFITQKWPQVNVNVIISFEKFLDIQHEEKKNEKNVSSSIADREQYIPWPLFKIDEWQLWILFI